MTDADRVFALQRLGYTPRQAQFLVRVALHSGYFLRRHYVAFTGHGHGLATTRFLANLAAREHAKPLPHPRLGHLWHLCAKPVYAAIDQVDNRHRRPAEWAAVIRKLMTLDFVLAHQEAHFYAAEADKVALLRDSYAVPETCWPAKLYAAKDPTGAITVRYFVDKMPWFREASDARLWMSYVDDGETLAGFETFLTQYRSLLGSIRSGLVHVSRSYDARVAAMFRRVVLGAKNHSTEQGLGSQSRPLLEYCHLRRKLEARDWTGLTKADLHRFRDLRNAFSAAAYDVLYHRWVAGGDAVLARPNGLGTPSDCAFRAYRVPFEYGDADSPEPVSKPRTG